MTPNNPIRALSLTISPARRLSTLIHDPQPLYHRISALGRAPRGSLPETMQRWLSEGKTVTRFDLMGIVKELRRYKSYRLALELIDWMETGGMNITFGNHAQRLDLILKVRGIDMAEKYFSDLPEQAKNQMTYGALLNSYCQKLLTDKAVAVYENMKQLGFAPNCLACNSLMTLYMKLGQYEKVLAQFEEMKSNNVTPDIFTYCLVMNSYSSLNDVDSVERVVEEMKEVGHFALNWSVYTNLAVIYNKAGLSKKAESALKKAEEVMNRRDRTPYPFLISLYAGAGNLAEVLRVWKLQKVAFPKATNTEYCRMLQALRNLGDMDALKQVFEEWESVYVNFDAKLANVVIDAYLGKGMIKEAESVWEKATEKGLGSDFRTLDLFADYYLNKGEIGSAMKCLEVATHSAKQDLWKPSKEKVNAFMKYYEDAKDVDGVEALYRNLKKLDCIDAQVYESLLRTYLLAGKTEPSLGQRINDDGIEISSEAQEVLEKVSIVG